MPKNYLKLPDDTELSGITDQLSYIARYGKIN